MSDAAIHNAPTESVAVASSARPRHPGAGSAAGFLASLFSEIRADLWLYVLVALYFIAVGMVAIALGQPQDFRPFLYLGDGIQGAFGILVPIALTLHSAFAGALRSPLRPIAGFRDELVGAMTPRFVAGFLLLCGIFLFYSSFTSTKNLLPDLARFDWDIWLADTDRALHGGRDPATVLSEALGPQSTLVLDFIYGRVWFVVLLGTSTWAALSTRYAHLRVQFFMTMMVCWVVLGNVLAAVFLSGGPIYYGELTNDPLRFAALRLSLDGTTTEAYANYLWALSQHRTVGIGTGISAFPSMHISICMLLAIYLWRVDRRLGVLGLVYTAIMLAGSIRLGWHYALDGYASIVLTPVAWLTVAWIRRKSITLNSRPQPLTAELAASEV